MTYAKVSLTLVVLSLVAAFTAAIFALDSVDAARSAQDKQRSPATEPMAHEAASTAVGGVQSYAGATPAGNPDTIAASQAPFPAELPPLHAGRVLPVRITLKDVTVPIAPGVRYRAWGFDGGAPGPVVHVRQGQTVRITLTNGGAIPHSIDFHAARIAPNVAFRDVEPGKSITYSFRANDPGVFVYHCGTKPVLAHIANGMYGAIVVDPAKPLPPSHHQYVLVASEWYLDSPGTSEPASLDMTKARLMMPDWVTFNGYAGQYKAHPLEADPGHLVRFYVANAGPSLVTAFHVVGTIFSRVYPEGDMTHPLTGVQTSDVPAGGGAVFEVKIDQPGLYPFVNHSFASVDMGQVGILNVGDVEGTASH